VLPGPRPHSLRRPTRRATRASASRPRQPLRAGCRKRTR